jgi:hypothetical protein
MSATVDCLQSLTFSREVSHLASSSPQHTQRDASAVRDRQSRRMADRKPFRCAVWMTSLSATGFFDRAFAQNASACGLSVTARQSWCVGQAVLVSLPPGFSAHARVVYCHRLPSEDFAVGLKLTDSPKTWLADLKNN